MEDKEQIRAGTVSAVITLPQRIEIRINDEVKKEIKVLFSQQPIAQLNGKITYQEKPPRGA